MELWFRELHTPGAGITLKVNRMVYRGRSAYQEISVLDTEDFGRMLVIDGLIMLTERDEFIYHEMIAHPALTVHQHPRNVLIIGGGDGGTAREVLRHSKVEAVTLCEIDDLVLKVAQEYFPRLSSKLYSDRRVNIIVKDATHYVRATDTQFDVILVDSSDPVGPAKGLFERDFLLSLRHVLRPDGIAIFQSESPFYHAQVIKSLREGLKDVGFTYVNFYWAHIPTYPGGVWCWAWASNTYHPIRDLGDKTGLKLDLEAKGEGLRYYDLEIHRASFHLPQYMKQYLGG